MKRVFNLMKEKQSEWKWMEENGQSGVRDFNEKAQENTHYIIFRDLFVLFVFFSFWFISCFIPLHYK